MKAPRVVKRVYPSGNVTWQVHYVENGEKQSLNLPQSPSRIRHLVAG